MNQAVSKKTYSKGVFLRVLNSDPKQWSESMDFVGSLPGVQHIEIWMEYLPAQNGLDYLASLVQGYAILIHAPFIHQALLSHHPEINRLTLNIYSKTLEIAKSLRAKVVTFHAGTHAFFMKPEEALNLFVKNFALLEARKGDVAITVENLTIKTGVMKTFPATFYDMTLLKKALPGIKFTFDIGHCIQNGEESFLPVVLRDFKGSIANIHFHDAIRGQKSHLALGRGTLNLPWFFQVLSESGYDNYLTLETKTDADTKESWHRILPFSEFVKKK